MSKLFSAKQLSNFVTTARLGVFAAFTLIVGCNAQPRTGPAVEANRRASVLDAPKTPSHQPTLATTAKHLDRCAAALEDNKDVKCWTSFKLLETFVAGSQLAPQATHVKTQVVLNYLDQIWRTAAERTTQAFVDGAIFEQVSSQVIPQKHIELIAYHVTLGNETIVVPYQDHQNYLSTIEPVRLLQTLAQRISAEQPDRLGLTEDAVARATQLAALLSNVILKKANVISRDNQHQQILSDDIMAADKSVSEALGLHRYEPASDTISPADSVVEQADPKEAMLALIEQKLQSLEAFNTKYSRDTLDREFKGDLSEHEVEWAGMPIDLASAKAYKSIGLVTRAKLLYTQCAQQHPGQSTLNGAQMLETVLSFYPFVISYDGGTTVLFPDHPTFKRNLSVFEFEADSFRDSGWHWRALQIAVTESRHEQPSLPAMNLYAMEELSEFMSVYAVALVRLAGTLAEQNNKSSVNSTALRLADGLLANASRKHRATVEKQSDSLADDVSTLDTVRQTVRNQIRQQYVDEIFSDVTSRSGIDFRHESSQRIMDYRFAPTVETTIRDQWLEQRGYKIKIPHLEVGIAGGGVAVGDADCDGLLDIYLVSGSGDRLYRNLGQLQFEDITTSSGLSNEDEGRGAYFIDYDNDGDQDLFVTHVYAPCRLFQNQGDGTFEDVTRAAGLSMSSDRVSHSSVWFDFNNDGHLDVYIGNFTDWLGGVRPVVGSNSRNGQPNQLFLSDGLGRFEDATKRANAGDVGWTHAVSHTDANGDGWQDLYLANDFGADVLLLNKRGQQFVDATPESLRGKHLHGMSVGFTDVNGDSIEDIYVSNIAMFSFVSKYIKPTESTPLTMSRRTTQNARMLENNMFLVSSENEFLEQHDAYFDRSRDGCGWAWDADMFDFDNDGHEDVYIANGREPGLSYDHERNVLYKQNNGHFHDVSSGSGADFRSNSRGAVHADLDKDGDLDIIVNNFHGPAVLLRNNLQRHNWVRLHLQGTSSNRDAIGARVILQTASSRQIRTVRGGSGFLSKEPCTVHFGLADEKDIQQIEINWPSGQSQTVDSLEINRQHTIVEP